MPPILKRHQFCIYFLKFKGNYFHILYYYLLRIQKRIKRYRFTKAFIFLILVNYVLIAQQTNLELFQALSQKILSDSTILSQLNPALPVFLNLKNVQDAWILAQPITSTLVKKGYEILVDSMQELQTFQQVTILPTKMNIAYGKIHRRGMFGTRKTSRICTLTLSIEITQQTLNRVILSDSFTVMATDTVSVDMIPSLENSSISCTQAVLTDESFFDRVIEPLIIVGTTGVAILLFFTIRS